MSAHRGTIKLPNAASLDIRSLAACRGSRRAIYARWGGLYPRSLHFQRSGEAADLLHIVALHHDSSPSPAVPWRAVRRSLPC